MENKETTPLGGFDGRQFHGVLDFMYDLQNAGFADEHDNSFVMRALWDKVDLMGKKVGKIEGHVYMDLKIATDTAFKEVLVITLSTPYNEEVKEEVRLIVRNDRIAVLSNVITDKVQTHDGDLPVQGSSVYWPQAEKMFKAQERFSKKALSAFRAVHRALCPKDSETACRLHLKPTPGGWLVDYYVKGEKVLTLHYKFSK